MRLSKFYFGLTAASLMAGIVLPILPLVAGMWVSSTDYMTALGWMAVGFGMAGYVCSLARERGKRRGFMISALVTGVCAYVTWAWSIGLSSRSSDILIAFYIAMPLTGWTTLLMFVGILEMIPTRVAWLQWLRGATIAVATILTIFVVLVTCYYPSVDRNGTWEERNTYTDLTVRCGGVLAILVGLGTIVLAIASLLPRVSRDEVPLSERLEFGVVCPRCELRQRLLTDGAQCGTCGLRIKVTPT